MAAAFQGLAKALPNEDDPKSREKFDKIFDDIGMTDENKNNLIDLLQAAGAVASVIGSIVPVVGAALAVLTLLLGFLKEGPSALELMVTRRFDDLERKVKALEVQIQQRFLLAQRNTISAAVAALKNYIVEITNTRRTRPCSCSVGRKYEPRSRTPGWPCVTCSTATRSPAARNRCAHA